MDDKRLRVALGRHVLLRVLEIARAIIDHCSGLVLVHVAAVGSFPLPLTSWDVYDMLLVLEVL